MFQDMQSLMKEAEALQGRMAEMKERLAAMVFQGSAAEGAITVTINGVQEVQRVNISTAAADQYNLKEIEDSLREATNQALQLSQQTAAAEMEKISGGLNPAKLLQSLGGFKK